MLWWKKFKAWLRGEELRVEHLIPELVEPVKRLTAYSEQKVREAEQAALEAERALAKKVAAEAERIKADIVSSKVAAIYREVDALVKG